MKSEIAFLHLRSHKLFNNLSREDLYRALDEITIKRKKKGEIFEPVNNEQDVIYFVLKGKIKIQNLDHSGHEVTKDIIKDGDFFGNIVHPLNDVYEYGTVVSDELVYFVFSSKRFEELSLEIPQLGINLSKELTLKLKSLEHRYASLVADDVQTRLIHFFSDWANEEGEKLGAEVRLKNYLTHNDIANLISTCRQTVTSILNRLKTKGNILYSRSRIVIPNLDRLKEVN